MPESIPFDRAMSIIAFLTRAAYEDGYIDGVRRLPDDVCRIEAQVNGRTWADTRTDDFARMLRTPNDDEADHRD